MLKFFSNSYVQKASNVPAEKYLNFSNFLAEHLCILQCFVFLFLFCLSSGNFLNHFLPHEKIHGIFMKCMTKSLKQDMDEVYRYFFVYHCLYKYNNTYWQKRLYLFSHTFKSSCSFQYFIFPFSSFWFSLSTSQYYTLSVRFIRSTCFINFNFYQICQHRGA